jgi:hypothetical protein
MILGQLATPARPPDRPAHDSLQKPDSPAGFPSPANKAQHVFYGVNDSKTRAGVEASQGPRVCGPM